MGFNGVRKHQKIEDPRYLYWADRLGLLVWEEMPSAYRFTHALGRAPHARVDGGDRARLSHPCIVAWVPFNESWGVPNLPDSPAERHYVQALYHLTKTLDPTRPVIGNDGWESVATDIIGIHDYDDQPGADRRALPRRRASCRGCSSASAPAGGCWCSTGSHARRACRSCSPSSAASRSPSEADGHLGLLAGRRRRRVRRSATRQLLARGALARACSPGSATRSSPTPTRRPTACCTPTGRRSSRSTEIAAATRGRPRRVGPRPMALEAVRDGARHDERREPPRRRDCDCSSASSSKPDGRALCSTLARRSPTSSRRRARRPRARRAEPAPALASAARRVGGLRQRTARTARSCRRRSTTRWRRTTRPAPPHRAAGRALRRRRVREPVSRRSASGRTIRRRRRSSPRARRAAPARWWCSRRTRRRRWGRCRSRTSSC